MGQIKQYFSTKSLIANTIQNLELIKCLGKKDKELISLSALIVALTTIKKDL